MNLRDHAYRVDELGEPAWVIEDAPILQWAARNGVSPVSVQVEILQQEIVPYRYLKNFHALNFTEQIRLCESKVFICGCGGLGGALIHLLVRAGVGHLRLVDGDTFVTSNLNRQWLSEPQHISRPKALVGKERAEAINPLIEVEAFSKRLNEETAGELMRGMDLALDALDNLPGRFTMADTARRLEIPFVHAAVAGWWGQVSTFLPGSAHDLESIYGRRRSRDPKEDAVGILGPAASVIGSLEAFEAIRILSGKKPAYSGQLLYFDGESGRTEILPL